MSEGEPKEYNIFNDFEILETIIGQMENRYTSTEEASFCDNINFQTNKEKQIKDICKMFVALFNASTEQCLNENKELKEKNYPEFMNYFINNKLNEAAYRKTEKKNFYREMTSKHKVLKDDDELKNRMYFINDKYLINFNILYKLYKNYDKLNPKRYKDCKDILEEMKSQYNYGLEKCFYDGNFKFCKALEKFRNCYEEKKAEESSYCTDKPCPDLPELILSFDSKNELLRTSKIGNILIGTSYAPYLKGHNIDTSGEYFYLKYLIFLQYNLHMEEDNDENNCVMIKILHQFFQYCTENKKNLKLSSFMKEFIKEFYEKKRSDYTKIFTECNNDHKSKNYCQLYTICKGKFEKDLNLIQNNSDIYIKEQEEFIEILSPLDFFILEAKDMFQDFKKMSKYSPTIMSTMVAIVVCLFFLYKVIPFNSIFGKGKEKRKKIPLFFPERIKDIKDDNTGHKNIKPKRGKIRFSYQPI